MADVELIESLKSHIASDLLENSIEFDSNTNLFDSKIIDSFKILVLVVYIEEEFGLSLGADDLTEENFQTLSALAALIERKKGLAG
jgi:acyl carrier protein